MKQVHFVLFKLSGSLATEFVFLSNETYMARSTLNLNPIELNY